LANIGIISATVARTRCMIVAATDRRHDCSGHRNIQGERTLSTGT